MASKNTWDDSHDKILLMSLLLSGDSTVVLSGLQATEIGERMGFQANTVRSVL